MVADMSTRLVIVAMRDTRHAFPPGYLGARQGGSRPIIPGGETTHHGRDLRGRSEQWPTRNVS